MAHAGRSPVLSAPGRQPRAAQSFLIASTSFGQAQPDSAGHSMLVFRLAGSETAAATPSTGEKKKKKKRKAKKADGEGAAKEEL